jgi:hypothetical protein
MEPLASSADAQREAAQQADLLVLAQNGCASFECLKLLVALREKQCVM